MSSQTLKNISISNQTLINLNCPTAQLATKQLQNKGQDFSTKIPILLQSVKYSQVAVCNKIVFSYANDFFIFIIKYLSGYYYWLKDINKD